MTLPSWNECAEGMSQQGLFEPATARAMLKGNNLEVIESPLIPGHEEVIWLKTFSAK